MEYGFPELGAPSREALLGSGPGPSRSQPAINDWHYPFPANDPLPPQQHQPPAQNAFHSGVYDEPSSQGGNGNANKWSDDSTSAGAAAGTSGVRKRAKRRSVAQDVDEDDDEDDDGSDGASGDGGKSRKKHPCPQCNKKFNRPSSLRIHLNTHTGAMPYVCPHPNCGRAFNVNSNMRRHFRNHIGASGNEPVEYPASASTSEQQQNKTQFLDMTAPSRRGRKPNSAGGGGRKAGAKGKREQAAAALNRAASSSPLPPPTSSSDGDSSLRHTASVPRFFPIDQAHSPSPFAMPYPASLSEPAPPERPSSSNTDSNPVPPSRSASRSASSSRNTPDSAAHAQDLPGAGAASNGISLQGLGLGPVSAGMGTIKYPPVLFTQNSSGGGSGNGGDSWTTSNNANNNHNNNNLNSKPPLRCPDNESMACGNVWRSGWGMGVHEHAPGMPFESFSSSLGSGIGMSNVRGDRNSFSSSSSSQEESDVAAAYAPFAVRLPPISSFASTSAAVEQQQRLQQQQRWSQDAHEARGTGLHVPPPDDDLWRPTNGSLGFANTNANAGLGLGLGMALGDVGAGVGGWRRGAPAWTPQAGHGYLDVNVSSVRGDAGVASWCPR
ncbi:hypothetical protein HMN09_01163600 [Mycena chlorophos]|uniref:C2H2-type domain-containing protein n=1 Tax=Mycena chlorophos TaxID=658473 RepID=A0A8H6VUF3_MYCCL|nr:hypothetical protein HMN09_01163600 [Mycena chlorophos]